jgi:glycerol-3-phosphate acyltransferase PlsY
MKEQYATKGEEFSKFLRLFLYYIIGLGITAFLLFYCIKLLKHPHRTVFQISFLYIGYDIREIDNQPIPYLLSIIFISSVIGAVWSTFFDPKSIKRLILQILSVPWVSVILTGPFWGLIWSIERWGSLSIVDWSPTLMMYYRHDLFTGLFWSWLSAMQSYPINILSYFFFCVVLFLSKKENIQLIKNRFSRKADFNDI